MYTVDVGHICGGSTVCTHALTFNDMSCIQAMYVVYSEVRYVYAQRSHPYSMIG